MQIENLYSLLDANFPDKSFKNLDEIEFEVHKYMKEISRKFLEMKIQLKVDTKEKDMVSERIDSVDNKLVKINKQKKN